MKLINKLNYSAILEFAKTNPDEPLYLHWSRAIHGENSRALKTFAKNIIAEVENGTYHFLDFEHSIACYRASEFTMLKDTLAKIANG